MVSSLVCHFRPFSKAISSFHVQNGMFTHCGCYVTIKEMSLAVSNDVFTPTRRCGCPVHVVLVFDGQSATCWLCLVEKATKEREATFVCTKTPLAFLV